MKNLLGDMSKIVSFLAIMDCQDPGAKMRLEHLSNEKFVSGRERSAA